MNDLSSTFAMHYYSGEVSESRTHCGKIEIFVQKVGLKSLLLNANFLGKLDFPEQFSTQCTFK